MEKEPYELCDHEYAIRRHGSKICLSCGLEERYLSHTPEEGYENRVFVKNTGPDHVVEIRKEMRELMDMVVRETTWCDFLYPDGIRRWDVVYVDPPEAGLPYEFHKHSEELCQVCNEYKLLEGHLWKKAKRGSPIRCQTHSLCAAVLWEKVKLLYPMSMAEFAERVGISKPTIINTCKKMRQIDLN